MSGPQCQMIGVAQDHLGPGRGNLVDRHSLDGALRANRHEARCFDRTVWRQKKTATRRSGRIAVRELKFEVAHEMNQSPRIFKPRSVSFSRTSFRLVTPKFLHSSMSSPVFANQFANRVQLQPRHAFAGSHRQIQVRDRAIEQRLLVGRHVAGIDRWIAALLFVRELTQRQSFAGQHFTNFIQARFAEVLAAQQFRFAGSSQIADRFDAHLLQTVATANAQFEVRDGHVQGLSQAIVASLCFFVVQHVAGRRRILHVQQCLRMIGIAIQNPLVAHLCFVVLVVVFVDQAQD